MVKRKSGQTTPACRHPSLTKEGSLEKAALVPESEQPYPIPKSWVWTRMGDLTRIVGGGTPRSHDPALYENGVIPWIRPVDLSGYDDIYISQGSRNITEAGLRDSSARLIPRNSLLFSSRAPIGYVAIAANDVTTSQGFKSFLPTSVLVPQYGYWYLKYAKPLAEELASGTTFQEISGSKAAMIPIPLPPLPEQQRIAEKLESLLGKIKEAKALLDEIPEILQNFRQTVLAAACSGRLTADWRKKNQNIETAQELFHKISHDLSQKTKFKTAKKEKAIKLYDVPDSWIWKFFSDVCLKIFDGTHFSPKNGPVGDFMYITAKNIKPWGVDLSDVTYVSKTDHQKIYSHSNVKYRDILYIKDGATAGIATVNYLEDEFSLLSSVGVFRVKPEYILPEYVSIFLNAPAIREQMLSKVTGVAITRLTLTKLNSAEVCLPPTVEQQEIVRRVESLFSKADALEAQYKEAMGLIESLPEIILSKAFRGKLVPQDPNDESAIKLLERIANEAAQRKTECLTLTK